MFVNPPPQSPEVEALYAASRKSSGYVMNLTRLWAWRPDVMQDFMALRNKLTDASTLSAREKALIVCATAASIGDSYCSLAWGAKLAHESDPETAAAVLEARSGAALSAREQALVQWVRHMVRDPNGTTAADVASLRSAGFSEREIVEATVFAAFRLAFSVVNDALGASPDRELVEQAPAAVRSAVTYGREPAQAASD